MDTLPFEILTEVLTNLSPSSRKNARLASHRFNAALAKPSFSVLASFVDPDVAQSTIESAVSDVRKRPRSIWSPRCAVPVNLPIPESFLLAMYAALKGSSWPARRRRDPRRMAWSGLEEGDSSSESGSDGSDSSSEDGRYVSQFDEDDFGTITVQNLNAKLGRSDITEAILRQALFRYSLYMSYMYEGEGVAPQLWIFEPKKWALQS